MKHVNVDVDLDNPMLASNEDDEDEAALDRSSVVMSRSSLSIPVLVFEAMIIRTEMA